MNAPSHLLEPVIRAQLAILGLRWAKSISWNDGNAKLFQEAVLRGEADVTATGGLAVTTGGHTGRSPKDKFIVRNAASQNSVWWEANASIEQAQFDVLKADMFAHARMKSLFVQDLVAGADSAFSLETRVITEFAWQALFMRHLLRQADAAKTFTPRLTIIDLPSFKADPARHGTRSEVVIAFDLRAGLVLIGGTEYAGEIKKAVFTVMNHMLPEQGVLPMHCAANVGLEKDTVLFFGLSGTGKTTLSADQARNLIGDDEHGWSDKGVFNIEGGCYAKAIGLSPDKEPDIHAAAQQFATVYENVVLSDETHEPEFDNNQYTDNTRLAYPLSAIANASSSGVAPHPKAIVMLSADAFGVLPAIARLTEQQAMDFYLAGYTAKVAGTEKGVTEPQATFSACFGAPFLTRHPSVYGGMLADLMRQHQVPCYLVNTGWTGGAYGVGKRMSLELTRKIVSAAINGSLEQSPMRCDEHFGFDVPMTIEGVEASVLNPAQAWSSADAYTAAATRLAQLFAENATRFSEPMRVAAE
jgi:phosphoenolpyruvate carboxykinase (ATP)